MSERAPSPTDTEWNTFQVMANPEFVNIRSQKPSFQEKRFVDDDDASEASKKESEGSRTPSPVALSEALDSISVVAEKMAHTASAFKPVMPALQEESDEDDSQSRSGQSHTSAPREIQRPYEPSVVPSVAPTAVTETYKVPKLQESSEVASEMPEPDFDIPKYTKKTPDDVKRRAKEMTEADILLEKEGLLAEIELLQKQEVIKLQRQLSIQDSLEEIQFQQDRAMSNYNAMQTVEMAKGGIKVMSTLMESAFRYMGLKLMDGFSGHLCKDMTRFNRPLTKMYRKQWRGVHMSPETEMAVIVFGAVLVTIMHNKGLGMFANMMPGIGASNAPTATPPLARPVVPPPVPQTQNIPTQNIPTVPIMRRPKTAEVEPSPKVDIPPALPEKPMKTVSLHQKPAKKRNEEPVLNL